MGRGRRYRVTGELDLMTSVTTRLNIIDKPGLVRWARKDSLAYATERLLECEPGNLPGEDEYPEYIQRVMESAEDPPVVARDLGTATHALLESWIKDDPKLVEDIDPDVVLLVKPAVEMAKKHVYEMGLDHTKLISEIAVWSPEHQYAGTIDLLGQKPDGTFVVVDWKRAKGLYGNYAYQVSAYCGALAELLESGHPIEAQVCLLPSEPDIAPDRKRANIRFGLRAFLAAKALHEIDNLSQKQAWSA